MQIIKKNNKRLISVFSFASLIFLSLFFISCEGDDEEFELNSDVISDLNKGILNGTITENTTLDANIEYKLTGSFVVQTGAALTIPAGTNIIAKKGGSNIFIVVLEGAQIFINGTADKPVFIGTEDQIAGGWSGITIFGGAKSLGMRAQSALLYANSGREDDNSGAISYLNIAGAGNFLSIEERTNGLALYGIGSGTEINNLSIINSGEDALDIYGGSVSINNLYIENAEGHAINWNEGWDGTITNTYILDRGKSIGLLGGNFLQEDDENPIDYNFPTFNNLTLATSSDFKNTDAFDNTVFKLHYETGVFVTDLHIPENIYVDVNMLNSGDVSNLYIDGVTADVTMLNMENGSTTFTINTGKDSAPINISEWNWIGREL